MGKQKLTCHRCFYSWESGSKAWRIGCPMCGIKVKNPLVTDLEYKYIQSKENKKRKSRASSVGTLENITKQNDKQKTD